MKVKNCVRGRRSRHPVFATVTAAAFLAFALSPAAAQQPELRFTKEVAAQRYTTGTAVSVTLPAAAGGTPPLSYALTPDPPAGLSFDAAARVLSGTPSAAAAEATYTLTATDADGYSADLRFSITVTAAGTEEEEEEDPAVTAAAKARGAELAKVLTSFGSAVAADAVDVIGERFSAERPLILLVTGPDGPDLEPGAALAGARFTAPAPGGLAVWGRGSLSGFSTATEDGRVWSGYLGLDWRWQPELLTGAAVSYGTAGGVTYRSGSDAGTAKTGRATVTMAAVMPYVHWSPAPGLGLWGLAGIGSGGAAATPAGSSAIETGLTMSLGAIGGRYDLLGWPGGGAAVKADGFLASLSSAARPGLAQAAAAPGRARLLVEARTRWEIADRSWLQPAVEAGGRWDGALGGELGGGVSYRHTGIGLGVDVRGRYVLAANSEWGAGVGVTYTPGENGWTFGVDLAATGDRETGLPAAGLMIYGSLRT